MTKFSKLDVDLFPYGALIVVVKDVAVSLPNGVPGWDLCHQGTCLAGMALIDRGRTAPSVGARALVLPRLRMS